MSVLCDILKNESIPKVNNTNLKNRRFPIIISKVSRTFYDVNRLFSELPLNYMFPKKLQLFSFHIELIQRRIQTSFFKLSTKYIFEKIKIHDNNLPLPFIKKKRNFNKSNFEILYTISIFAPGKVNNIT